MNEDEDIQKGAKVVLRDGGPEMTVLTRSQNLVYCSWVEDEETRQGTFEVESVQLASLASGEALLRRTSMSGQTPVTAMAAPAASEASPAEPPSEPPDAA